MSEPFLAEIRIVGFNFAPRGWAQCDGQILPINQNQSLYSLLGTIYGGDGRTSFALPDLRGRTPIHMDTAYRQGQKVGEEDHFLAVNEIPLHNHQFQIENSDGNAVPDAGKVISKSKNELRFIDDAPVSTGNMNSSMIANTGSGQSHENMQPYLTLNYVIAIQGVFPSRS